MVGKSKEYCESTLYKMVFLLSGYRALMCNSVTDVVRKIKKYRIAQNRATGEMDMNFILLIDTGFEALNEDEVRIYSDYIATFMHYDKNKFFNLLKNIASSTGSPETMPQRTKIIVQAEAMHQIFRDMD